MKKNLCSPLILLLTLVIALPESRAQVAETPADGRGSAPARPALPGSESVRLQSSWALFRTAAANLLRWNVGVPASSFPEQTFAEAAKSADALGVALIEGFDAQHVSPELPKKLGPGLSPDEMAVVRTRMRALNLRMPVFRVETLDADSQRRLFEFARDLGINTLILSPGPAALPDLDRLANEFEIDVAIENRGRLETPAFAEPRDLLDALEGHSRRIGIAADIGAWMREGVNPAEGLSLVRERLMVVGLRDRSALGPEGRNVTLGQGRAEVEQLLLQLHRQDVRPIFISVHATGAGDPFTDLTRSLASFEKAIHPVMTERVHEIARTDVGRIRGPDRLPSDVREQIAAAVPRQAPAQPKKPRKLLVMDINVGYSGHETIPHGNLMIELMGQHTGAFEPVFSNDFDNLKYPNIRQFDAILLNNTVGQVFVDPQVRSGLLRFVREGGGLGGIHGASYTSPDWSEFSELLGAAEGPHRIETGTLKIDDPESPLTRHFEGRGFVITDEFYRFYAHGPYSRERVRVLLSLDVERSDIFGGRPLYTRPDHDYGLSWIRSYGEGRVFYCALGHTPDLFTTPTLAEYVLAGIQFILGDLEADTTPSARLPSRGNP